MDRKIPTPTISYIEIGPLTIHFYAICIIIGIALAIEIAKRRYTDPEVISELAIVAIPFGLIGARLYHVFTWPTKYLNGNWIDIFKIWEGGLGIWGAIAGGALAVYLKARKLNLDFIDIVDAVAPGLLVAQAIGRFGNWFNGELFGKPTNLPWGLKIPETLRPTDFSQYEFFHPTFLYEAICSAILAFILIKFQFKRGATFAFYIFGYCTYRFFIEGLRIDPATMVGGLRINQIVSLVIAAPALTFFIKYVR